jgi:SAM-dependent methyltransferase
MIEQMKHSFNAVSENYRYRLPYHRKFFEELSKKLSLTSESKILDVCCGHGQLSVGLANKIKKAVAIDSSPGMLSHAIQHPSIIYINHDINSPPLSGSLMHERFDHFLIGRAIHWIRTVSLQDAIVRNLNAGGRIVVCGAGWSSNTVWLEDFQSMRRSYGDGRKREFYGKSKLSRIGFEVIDTIDVRYQVNCDLNFLLSHAMSFTSCQKRIEADLDNFKETLSDRMRPFLKNGILSGEASCWALIYGPT